MADSFVLIGKVGAPHGIRGAVRLVSYASNPSSIFTYAPLYLKDFKSPIRLSCISSKTHPFIASVEGITSRNDAEHLKNAEIYVHKDTLPLLPSDEFYYEDLMGLEIRTCIDSDAIGKITAIHNFGASDIIEVTFHNDTSEMYPLTKEFISEVNLEERYLILIK